MSGRRVPVGSFLLTVRVRAFKRDLMHDGSD